MRRATEFAGEVAECYSHYRRGYDAPVVEWLAEKFGLTGSETIVDLGCGTGQLATALSPRVRAVVGVDPEPDMLARAAAGAAARGRTNISWMLGSDRDLPALAALLGPGTITTIVIGNAIHLMDHSRLFEAAQALLRPGGGVAVLANGTPVWQQDSAASHALRQVLEGWFETELTSACGTDQASRDQYAGALRAGGYIDVEETVLQDYRDELTPEYLIGHLYSAIPSRQLPTAEQRPEFERRIRGALGPASSFTERVRVVALTARLAA